MPKKAPELGALAVSRLAKPGAHAVGGVAGLQLKINDQGGRSWVLRSTVGGKRREMGLGGYPDVSLAQARERARAARDQIELGVDPIHARQQARGALAMASARAKTFDQCVAMYIKSKSGEWKSSKHAQQWQSTLQTYASPVFGKVLVQDVELTHVLAVLEPIWTEKTTTANRLRGRIETIRHWAKVRKFRTAENPATWRGHLDQLLPAPRKISKVVHHPAVKVGELGRFMLELREMEGLGARALEFGILTAARSNEVRGARWSEFDWNENMWIIPADRMKGDRVHRVPLSRQAIALLESLPRFEGCDLLFPGAGSKRLGSMSEARPLSDMTLTACMRRMNRSEVPHGFRSTFRDWASEEAHYPREVAEQALSHKVADKVEAAYFRSDLLEKRRSMMQEWADFCDVIEKPAPLMRIVNGKAQLLTL